MGINMANQVASGMNANQQMPPAGPPPLAKPSSYYVAFNNQQVGPFDVQALPDKIISGQLTRQTLVWKQGMPEWIAAEKVPELASLFQSGPPPLPKG